MLARNRSHARIRACMHARTRYIFKEFLCDSGGLAVGVKREVDRERIIDDFVCLSFLLGNDFLPHLASADIDEGGLGSSLEV
jgi:5'-3' exonuclease